MLLAFLPRYPGLAVSLDLAYKAAIA